MGRMDSAHDNDEMEAAVLDAIASANAEDNFPTVDELSELLIRRGLAASEVATVADRLYRSDRISVNSAGGLHLRS